MKIAILSLGCKVNQYESGSIEKSFFEMGYEVTDKLEYADKYIINTCAVTNEAERKSRNMVTKCLTLNSEAEIYILGCAAQANSLQFEEKPNVVFVTGCDQKQKVLKLMNGTYMDGNMIEFEEYGVTKNSRTRSFLKVQDGCNNFCSYCIIPYLRGRSRSRKIENIIEEIRNLKEVNEIVLCGIDLSSYEPSLIELSQAVDKEGIRFRFGSLDVDVVTDDFIEKLVKLENFCPQFHLSLQSGSTKVLKSMNRHYSSEEYLEAVQKLQRAFKLCNITTDIVVGFPTETEEDFLDTCEFVKKVGFGDIHIFPFSKRIGTRAAKMQDLPKREKANRAKRLAIIRDELKKNYLKKYIGKKLIVLTEEIVDEYVVGHTENFLKLYLPKDTSTNKLIQCELLELYSDGIKAKIIKEI